MLLFYTWYSRVSSGIRWIQRNSSLGVRGSAGFRRSGCVGGFSPEK